MIVFLHVPIHISVNQTENDCLITHQCLVVTFGITDRLFVGPAISRFPPDSRWMPVLVFLFFDRLDPEVWNIHSHTVVETVSAVFDLSSQSRHTTYFFSDGDCILVDFMDQFVGQCQVCNRISILMSVVIITVVTESFS